MDVNPPRSALPPRMRKVWPQSPAPQSEPKQEDPRDPSKRTEGWRAHERWRSPPEVNAESPISVSGAAEGGNGTIKPGSPSGDGDDGADGQETEFDTETEADGLDGKSRLPHQCYGCFHFILHRYTTNASPADACIARSDHRLISCSCSCNERRVSSWLYPVGEEWCTCIMGTTTNADPDVCVVWAVEPVIQSRRGHPCSL